MGCISGLQLLASHRKKFYQEQGKSSARTRSQFALTLELQAANATT